MSPGIFNIMPFIRQMGFRSMRNLELGIRSCWWGLRRLSAVAALCFIKCIMLLSDGATRRRIDNCLTMKYFDDS